MPQACLSKAMKAILYLWLSKRKANDISIS